MTGNIQAESFSDEIKEQIKIRQNKLGVISNIDDSLVSWSNSKTAWIRMVSSVDIDGSVDFAKKYVLFGGTTLFADNTWFFKSGFDELSSDNSTYSKTDYGFKPIPSITRIKIDYIGANNGSVAYAEVELKVNSPEQLAIIDKLYMRPGYHVLVEWGHTIYLNNNGEKVNFTNFNTLPFDHFMNPSLGSTTDSSGDGVVTGKGDETYNKIDQETKKHYGNYGAFFGLISSFNWSFNQDGSYNINLKLISQGAVIESLKVNIGLDEQNKTNTNPENKPAIEFLKDITKFNKFLYDITISGENDIKTKYNLISSNTRIVKKDFIESVGWAWTRQTNTQYYLTLGGLLEYMEKNINIFSNNKRFLNYDYSKDNFCLTFNGHFSSDPRICLIPVGNGLQSDLSEFKNSSNPFVGNLMYLLINVNFLSSILVSLRNEKDGNVTIFEFLNLILTKINNTLGGINKLELFYNSDDGLIKILENAPLRYDNLRKNNNLAEFNLYGVTSEQGSFIKNIDFNISLNKDLTTSIVIGAAANGNQPGINSTSISQYNKGLIDRLFPEKFTLVEDIKVPTHNSEDVNLRFKNTNKKIASCLTTIYKDKKLSEETIKLLETLNNDYSDYIIGKYSESRQIPVPFYLPFDLELDLLGLGGIKIRQAFAVSNLSAKILPSFCRDNKGNLTTNFLVINASHIIENDTWTTKLRSIAVPVENQAPLTAFEEKTQVISQEKLTAVSCQQEATIKLSSNYNLSQLSCAARATKYSIPVEGESKTTSRGTFNRQQIISHLTDIALNVLEPIKAKYPTVLVTSGYRNKGGNSQHEIGQAVDLQFTDIVGPVESQNIKMLQRAKEIKALLGGYDQFLLEYKTSRGGRPWIHISWAKNNRKEASTFLNDTYASEGRNNFYNPLA